MYRYQLFFPLRYDHGYEPTGPVYRDGDLANVMRHVSRMLGVAYETTHSARFSRRPWVELQRRDKQGQWRNMPVVEQPVHYVPSVGDLGYSP